jgi:hypothetical protein
MLAFARDRDDPIPGRRRIGIVAHLDTPALDVDDPALRDSGPCVRFGLPPAIVSERGHRQLGDDHDLVGTWMLAR